MACDARFLPPEPEVAHTVTFLFRQTVLGNDRSLERNVEKARTEVKRILDRGLHDDVDVLTHRTVDKAIETYEGELFEGCARSVTLDDLGLAPGGVVKPSGLPRHRHDVV